MFFEGILKWLYKGWEINDYQGYTYYSLKLSSQLSLYLMTIDQWLLIDLDFNLLKKQIALIEGKEFPWYDAKLMKSRLPFVRENNVNAWINPSTVIKEFSSSFALLWMLLLEQSSLALYHNISIVNILDYLKTCPSFLIMAQQMGPKQRLYNITWD